MSEPFALFIRGPRDLIFELSDQLGFETELSALAVSIFEDGPDSFHIEALYETLENAEDALSTLQIPERTEAFITQLPEEDWVAKSQAGLPPVEAGRFWVYGTHDKDKIPKDISYPIKVDAGIAFGTGHHGTTKGCLLIFDDLLDKGFAPRKILDLGCGAGTLAIAAALALKTAVLATDIDPDAVSVTQQNAKDNRVGNLVRAIAADGFASKHLTNQEFDLVFANILAGPLMGLAANITASLAPGGRVILSGILDEQADTVSQAFVHTGLTIVPYPSINGWTSLLAIKPA
jgi:ribosomal protein L11 methyltransferase